MKAANRVVFNTGVLYVKLIITLIASLITTRYVLNALGETNYGIYSLVAGVVGMLGFLRASMSGAAMRFIGHSLGSGDTEKTKKTFNNVLFLHVVMGFILVILVEIVGLLLIENVLEIPLDKGFDAKMVFHFMVLTLFFTIIEVPYDGVINAHENLLALSIVDVIGVVLKLSIALFLNYVSTNLLILYGALMFGVQFIMRLIKQIYSSRKYDECSLQFRKYVNKTEITDILAFTGWNVFGAISSISITQVRSVLLNLFFGVTINAAEGISKKASTQINQVSVSLTRAIYPQILKSEGIGDRKRMLRITEVSTKFSLFLFSLFAIPIFMEASFLLNIWLTKVPEYAVIFTQLSIVAMFIEKATFEITNAIRAIGDIKQLTITESLIRISNIPIVFFLFNARYPAYSIFIVYIFISLIIGLERLYFGKKIAGMNIKNFLANGFLPILIPALVSSGIAMAINKLITEGFIRAGITFIFSITLLIILFRYFGLKKNEVIIFSQMISRIKSYLMIK